MTGGWVWLASYLALPILGWPLLSHAAFGRLPPASRVVLSGGSGAVLLSFAMTLSVLAGVPWNPGVLGAAAALGAFGLRALLPSAAPRETAGPEGVGPGGSAVPVAHALSALAVLAALAATAAGATGSPDLVFFWGAKAQHFAAARTIDPTLFHNPFHQFMHAYYPPLVTNLFAFASIAAGRFAWTAATLTFPLVLGALALGLPGVLSAAAPRAAAAAASALTVGALAYSGMEADVGGNGEMPLLFFETLSMALLLSPMARGRAGSLLTGVLLAGVATTKVEGLPFVLAAAALFIALERESARGAWRRASWLLGPTAVCLGAWFAFGAARGLFFGYAEHGRLFDLHADHLGDVLASTGAALFTAGYALPWLAPLACLLAAVPLPRRAALPLGVAATLAGFFLFTYLHRAEDPTLWISWSAARIFSPLAMLFALAAMPGASAETETRREPASPA